MPWIDLRIHHPATGVPFGRQSEWSCFHPPMCCRLVRRDLRHAGKGVDPADFDTLVAKHATSKISGFEDIAGVASFGFR